MGITLQIMVATHLLELFYTSIKLFKHYLQVKQASLRLAPVVVIHPVILLLARPRVRVHRVVLRDALLLGAGEHRQNAHREHLAGHRGSPVAPQEVQADISVGVNMDVLGTGLEEVHAGRFRRIVLREDHFQFEGLSFEDGALHASQRHLPVPDIATHCELAVVWRTLDELLNFLLGKC